MNAQRAVFHLVASTAACLLGCGARGSGGPAAAQSDGAAGDCLTTCFVDPGPGPLTDCAAQEAPFEFFTIWDFETSKRDAAGNPAYYGPALYIYSDRSTLNTPTGYEPPYAVTTDRCGPTHALHLQGGPYRGWGGGAGLGFKNLGQRCPEPGCPATRTTALAMAMLDLSHWEGISFWARRGPHSQGALRVGLGDRQTDDDISFLSYRDQNSVPRSCERNRECGCTDLAKSCTFFAGSGDPVAAPAGYYCWNPQGSPPDPSPTNVKSGLGDTYSYATCNTTKCDEAYAAYPGDASNQGAGGGELDPAFNHRACTPYSFNNGMTASYCYDPGKDHPPYDTNQVCGDHWVFPVALTNDWRFYRIPFTDLQQQGFGKKFAHPDLTAASMLRLMWDVGWIDYWIDDVAFYRTRQRL